MPLQIKTTAPFHERYTLLVESDMKAVSVVMQSTVQIRLSFSVLQVHDDNLEVELLLLDNVLLSSNNPLIKEVSSMNQVFGRMYNELRMIIDHKGNIIEVLNMDLVLSKWAQTKKELQAIAENNSDIKNIVSMNDGLFQNPDKLKAAIQGSEFFMVYFNEIFATYLPYTKNNIYKNNFFNSTNIPWEYKVQENAVANANAPDEVTIIEVKAVPAIPLDKTFRHNAYNQFAEQMDIATLTNITIQETGNYVILNKNGKLLEAVLHRNEIADKDKLYTKMTYRLTADNLSIEEQTPNKKSAILQ